MQKLIGKQINKILITNEYITFQTDAGDVSYCVVGDCCSYSYFYEISGADKVIGKKIVSVETIDDLPVEKGTENRGTGDPDCIEVYGIRINAQEEMTEIAEGVSVEISNSMLVVFRNNSNGYYGGSCENTTKHLGEDEDGVFTVTDNWITD